MAIFGKKTQAPAEPTFTRDSRKAKKFFDHARAVAQSSNHDYAVDCYINGLRHELDDMDSHRALREAALKRKAAGGKAAAMTEKLKKGGKVVLDKLLHAEMLASKDPLNPALLVDVMALGVEADTVEQEIDLAPLAYWFGELTLEANQTAKSPNKTIFIKVRDLFVKIQAFAKAVEACKFALRLDQDNPILQQDLKNLEAEQTMQEGRYAETADQEGGFRNFVKDADKQRQLEQEDAITKTASAADEMIQRQRAEYEKDPQDLDKLGKLVAALTNKETDAAEKEAIELLQNAFERTDQYRYKMRIGDIRIKQMNRRLRQIQARLKANPNDAEARAMGQKLVQHKVRFELEEFTERVKHYPTDLGLQFEMGKRQFALHQYDDAIAAFQQAKLDPKHRVTSLYFLGQCYAEREWFEEAVDTLNQGIEAHASNDDRLAMELRYQLILALKHLSSKSVSEGQLPEAMAKAKEAQKVASQVLQTDINFRDIRKQMDDIRKLVDELAKKK